MALSSDSLKDFSKKIDTVTEHQFASIDAIKQKNAGSITVYGHRHYNWGELVGVFFSRLFSVSFFGFIITALAVSLGAPFWFDLLNKLVSIRGSGVKPEEKKDAPKASATNDLK